MNQSISLDVAFIIHLSMRLFQRFPKTLMNIERHLVVVAAVCCSCGRTGYRSILCVD